MKNLQIDYGITLNHRNKITQYIINEKRINPNFRVIDVGGVTAGWSKDIADMIIDIKAENTTTSMNVDICDHESWNNLKNIVEVQGKYDFAICTHTLEDIYNPILVLKILPQIAKCGVITMPSISTELSNVESKDWLGFIHHRWIFDQVDGKMLIIPKLSLLENMCRGRNFYNQERQEIMYTWQDEIPYTMFMDNYLGPNASTVILRYNNLINGIKQNG